MNSQHVKNIYFEEKIKQLLQEKRKITKLIKNNPTTKIKNIKSLCFELFWKNFNIFDECNASNPETQKRIREDVQKGLREGQHTFHLHPLAQKIIKTIFVDLDLIPVIFPFLLYDNDIKVFDMLDIVAWNKKTETYACIDLKIGFEKYYGNHNNNNMNNMQIVIDNSTLNQHLVELLVKREMIRVNNNNILIRENECYLIRAIPELNEIHIYTVPSFIFQQGDNIYKMFCKKRIETLPSFTNGTKIEIIK